MSQKCWIVKVDWLFDWKNNTDWFKQSDAWIDGYTKGWQIGGLGSCQTAHFCREFYSIFNKITKQKLIQLALMFVLIIKQVLNLTGPSHN